LNGAVQEGKIIGIQLPIYLPEQKKQAVKLTVLEETEIQKWLNENNLKDEATTQQDIEKILDIEEPKAAPEEQEESKDMEKI